MIRTLVTTKAPLLIVLAHLSNCLAEDRVVSLSVQLEFQTNKRIIINGKTNLPPDTSLMIGLEDAVTGESRGQTKTKVLSNCTFKSEALGPLSGLKDGRYVASVTMPIARVQSDAVRRVIGNNGQNLKGPLVEKGTFGITVNAEKRFSVGGKNAATTQTERLKDDLDRYMELSKQIKELYAQLEKVKKKGLLDDENNFANLREWGIFARKFRSDHAALQKRVDEIDSLQARVFLGVMLGDVGSMFHDTAFKKDNEYRQTKSIYVDNLKELEAFIRERKMKISKNDRDSSPVRTTEFREWTDATGKYRVVARLISVADNAVQLEKKDGTKINIPLEKLSEKDQVHVRMQNR